MQHSGWGFSALDVPEHLAMGWGFRGIDHGNTIDIVHDRKGWVTEPSKEVASVLNRVLSAGLGEFSDSTPREEQVTLVESDDGLKFDVLRRGGYVYGAIYSEAGDEAQAAS